MITTEVFANRVEMRVLGDFTLADCKALETLSDYRVRFNGPIDLFLDFREMTGFTVDVAFEELRYVRTHTRDFNRVAVISDDQWITWGSWFSQFFMEADISIFDDEESAREWLGQAEPLPFSVVAGSVGQNPY